MLYCRFDRAETLRMRRWWLSLACVALLAACTVHGDPSRPIPTAFLPAPQPATRLLVLLPGRADDLDALRRSGAVQAIQAAWPDTDVVLAEVSLPYYLEGDAPRRLHDEVVVPLQERRPYRELWLAGASLGGMGCVMYDRAYPGEADGLVLLAPYLGEAPLLQEIRAAGGLARWQPGAGAPASDRADWQRALWRHLQAWTREPRRTRGVWLAYGEDDPLRAALPLLAPLLPPGHVLLRPGGHSWRVWTPALRDLLQRARPVPPNAGTATPS